MIHLDIGSASLVGQVRSANEDSVLVAEGLAAVADGMGGHRAGEVASAAAVEALAEFEGSRNLDDLVRGVHLANRRISERAGADPDLRGMGTTVCVVGLVRREGSDELAILNVGDSRVYLLADGELRQLSEDHSLVEALVREGRITAEEAATHPQKNVLTRALGVEPLVVVDAWLLSPRDGDRLLLCSDGLTNELDDDRIAEILGEGEPTQVTARRLAAEADAAGGRDNTSAVVVDVKDVGSPPGPPAGRFRRISTPAVDLSDEDGHGPVTETVLAVIAPPLDDDDGEDDEDEEDDVGLGEEEGDADDHDSGDGGAASAAPGAATAEDDDGDTAGAVPAGSSGDGDGDDSASGAAADGLGRSAEVNAEQLAAAQAEADVATARAARWRTAAFVMAIVGVIGLAVVAIVLTSDRGWYVGEDEEGHVALYRGTPVLWLEPEFVEQAPQLVEDLNPADQSTVRRGRSFTEEQEARGLIGNLSTTTTSTSTTTTTGPTTTLPTTTTRAPSTTSASGP